MVGPLESQEELLPDFLVRDVRESDREAVLALTARTWDFGDYIEWVFDDWLNDTKGRFLAAEHIVTGKLAAIDKMTFLSPKEAWFEGLRVAPEFRGHGLASRLQAYMIDQVRQAGGRTVRLLTSMANSAVHRMAYRDGFTLRAVFTFWKWTSPSEVPAVDDQPLRRATAGEAGDLHNWWLRSSAYRSAGLCHRNWSFSETSLEEWAEATREGRLFVHDSGISNTPLPPPSVLLRSEARDDGSTLWVIEALSAHDDDLPGLLAALVRTARTEGVAEINGLYVKDPSLEEGLRSSGFVPEDEGEPLCLFELHL